MKLNRFFLTVLGIAAGAYLMTRYLYERQPSGQPVRQCPEWIRLK